MYVTKILLSRFGTDFVAILLDILIFLFKNLPNLRENELRNRKNRKSNLKMVKSTVLLREL